MKKHNGFTVIELLIVVIIIAILAIIALAVYSGQVRNSRRTDAINTLFSMALAEESFRTTNTSYGTIVQVWNSVTTSTGGYYTLGITNITSTTYTLTATALGDQVNDVQGSTACNILTFAMSSGTVTKTPTACWPS